MAVTKTAAKTKGKAQSKTAPVNNKPAGRARAKSAPEPAKPARGRAAAKSTTAPAKPAARKTAAKPAAAKKAAAPAPRVQSPRPTSVADKKPWVSGSKVNKKTGFTEGTISDKIAQALLKGGPSRTEIVHAIPDLPETTKKGTKFQAANVAATVERQMVDMGFTVVKSYKLVPPKRGA